VTNPSITAVEPRLPTLKHLNLAANGMDVGNAMAILTALKNSGLKSLSLAYNAIGSNGAEKLACILPLTRLEFLDLICTDLHRDI
jgi:Ran GTPase-activating protein (RanGAP) involved in mRNA processing and transport